MVLAACVHSNSLGSVGASGLTDDVGHEGSRCRVDRVVSERDTLHWGRCGRHAEESPPGDVNRLIGTPGLGRSL